VAKTIKFNLICDDKPIRTIEDLRENFSVEDVLKYYENGLLLRWLEVRGYEYEKRKVSEIQSQTNVEVAKDLIRIFNIETDENEIEKSIYMLQFIEEQRELFDCYQKSESKVQQIIDDYHTGYKQLVGDIFENPKEIARIKAIIENLATNYQWVMKLNHRELFWSLVNKSELAIMCMLMNEKTRKYYLPQPKSYRLFGSLVSFLSGSDPNSTDKEDKTYDTAQHDIDNNYDKRDMYQEICKITKIEIFKNNLGDNLHTFAGVTDGYWKDIEEKGKKYMIISIEPGDFVRAAGKSGADLSSSDVVDKFPIIDGIDYKSNSADHKLLYMEV
jgi:hypothetical protein